MIAHIAGKVVEKTDNALIIDVGGVGYEVLVSAGDFTNARLDEAIKLHTYDHWRENAHDLFGFSNPAAKRLFELLLSVSGVGPKMGLALLSLGDAEGIRNAIARGDSAFVQRANGVGKRLAERIVVDLKDKVGVAGANQQAADTADDALSALLALGYSLQQSNEVLAGVDRNLTTEARIKLALKQMA